MTFDKSISVAPMMAWTDRHCRYLHRLYSPAILLFTEMVTTGALLRGGQWHQLDYSAEEHPIVLQLGGNDPADLARCAAEAARRGFDEINLNVGCPSDRVQQGTFGACLMLTPKIVAQCVSAMRAACDIPISVKCRLGVDDQDSDPLLQAFIDEVADGGCERFYIHARKAILGGLSPAQNRSVPPLQPERVARLKTKQTQFKHRYQWWHYRSNNGRRLFDLGRRRDDWARRLPQPRSIAHTTPALCRPHI